MCLSICTFLFNKLFTLSFTFYRLTSFLTKQAKTRDPSLTAGSLAETSTRETKHNIWRVRELKFIMLVGPEELTPQPLSPEQRDYRVFLDRL